MERRKHEYSLLHLSRLLGLYWGSAFTCRNLPYSTAVLARPGPALPEAPGPAGSSCDEAPAKLKVMVGSSQEIRGEGVSVGAGRAGDKGDARGGAGHLEGCVMVYTTFDWYIP